MLLLIELLMPTDSQKLVPRGPAENAYKSIANYSQIHRKLIGSGVLARLSLYYILACMIYNLHTFGSVLFYSSLVPLAWNPFWLFILKYKSYCEIVYFCRHLIVRNHTWVFIWDEGHNGHNNCWFKSSWFPLQYLIVYLPTWDTT